MKIIFKRFPVVGGMILKNLDSKSLVRSKEASREIAEILENKKFYFISTLRNYIGYFKEYKKSWNEVIHKAPIKILQQLTIAVQLFFKKYFNYPLKKQFNLPPLFIAQDSNNVDLCQLIISKTSEKNPYFYGSTALHEAMKNGHLNISLLMIENLQGDHSKMGHFAKLANNGKTTIILPNYMKLG